VIQLHCKPPGAIGTEVRIGAPVRTGLGALLEAACGDRVRFVIADRQALPAFSTEPVVDRLLEGGEAIKCMAGLGSLLADLADRRIDRRGVVVAIGGGATGDLGGLAAALWLRGVELVMVPTTLLSMVDSSVGGKTAIDLPQGKNLVGAFWPASLVLIDLGFVTTLPERELASGLGEVLKMAIGLDAELFELCERERDGILARDPDLLAQCVERALRAKIAIVERDPSELGDRRLLNLGHTLGHALEVHSGYRTAHGVAVARGMHHALRLAEAEGLLDPTDRERAGRLLEAYGFAPTDVPPKSALREFVASDKKVVGDKLHVVLPDAIGSSRTLPMTPDAFLAGL
jgi:3-dehydroquinate synthase